MSLAALVVGLVVVVFAVGIGPIDESSLSPQVSPSVEGEPEASESQAPTASAESQAPADPTTESTAEPQSQPEESGTDPTDPPTPESPMPESPMPESPMPESPTPEPLTPEPSAVDEADDTEPDTSAVVIDGGEWAITENDVERIRDFIELTHELDFTGPVGVVTSDDIGREYAAGFEPFSEDDWDLIQSLGLADQDADRQEANQLRLDRIRGLCCTPPGQNGPLSVVMELQPTKFGTELILMHELVHALHVQHPRLYANGGYDSVETPLTFSAAIEGVPQYVVFQYLEMASEEERESVAADLPIIRDDMLSLIDEGPARHLNWAYDTGANFVDGVVAERGAQGLSDLLANPPSTNEQIIFPDKYLSDEQAVRVAEPATPDGAVVVSEGTIGAALLMWMLAGQVGDQAALEFAATWAGDNYAIYEIDQRRCLAATIMVDEQSSEFGTELLAQVRVNFPDAEGEAQAGTTISFDTCGSL